MLRSPPISSTHRQSCPVNLKNTGARIFLQELHKNTPESPTRSSNGSLARVPASLTFPVDVLRCHRAEALILSHSFSIILHCLSTPISCGPCPTLNFPPVHDPTGVSLSLLLSLSLPLPVFCPLSRFPLSSSSQRTLHLPVQSPHSGQRPPGLPTAGRFPAEGFPFSGESPLFLEMICRQRKFPVAFLGANAP